MVHFVGAGPGAPDLITVRGQRLLEEADVIIYAGSLVNPALLASKKSSCRVYDSAKMTLEKVIEIIRNAEQSGLMTVRLHTGDPCLFGAVREQMDILDNAGIRYDSTPGVSSFCGAAAALDMEYTLPGISQSVVITRMAGRTPVPEKESIASFAAHGATMVVFLSAGMLEKLSEQLIAGGYSVDTPAAIVYKATWPDEKTFLCTVGTLAETAAANGVTKTALIIVGDTVAQAVDEKAGNAVAQAGNEKAGNAVAQTGYGQVNYERSKLYDPSFTTGYREGKTEQTGKITVIGMGPGAVEKMTLEACHAIESCDVIIGYTVYVDLIRDHFPGKQILSTGMRQEEERCALALKEADKGQKVAFVCSGDAGVYGMAGLLYEMAQDYPSVEVDVIPGVTAALSGAACLGAPLVHDFAVISLSDLMTPWEKIEKRLRAAAEGGFVIVLYNPASRKRADYLERACDILLETLSPGQICGTVRNIGRKGEEAHVCSLEELRNTRVDMFTTVFIGNSSTKQIGGKIVTPRGYAREQ